MKVVLESKQNTNRFSKSRKKSESELLFTWVQVRGGTEPEFSKLNRARAFTSRARAELRAHISNIFRARAELRAQIFRAEPSLTIIEPSPSRAFEPQKWKFFQYFEKFLRS